MEQCAGCGIEGVRADTTAGEIVEGGEVVAVVPAGSEILMVGHADGSCLDGLYCDDCAETYPRYPEGDRTGYAHIVCIGERDELRRMREVR